MMKSSKVNSLLKRKLVNINVMLTSLIVLDDKERNN
jgi:hypothetical protein